MNSSIPTEQFDGDMAVGRDITIGGNSAIRGSAKIGHNLIVNGWLEAKNIKAANKGLFKTEEQLRDAYPTPEKGWWALVAVQGSEATDHLGQLYISDGKKWVAQVDSSENPVLKGNPTIEHKVYTEAVDQITTDLTTVIGDVKQNKDQIKQIRSTQASDSVKYETLYTQLSNTTNAGLQEASEKICKLESAIITKRTIISPTSRPASSFFIPQIQIKEGDRFIIRYSNATPGVTRINNVALANNNGASVIKDLQIDKTVTEESGSFEITATTDATHLRMYVIGAGCDITIDELLPISEKINRGEAHVNKRVDDITSIQSEMRHEISDLANRLEIQQTIISPTSRPASSFFIPKIQMKEGDRFIIRYSNATPGVTRINNVALANNNGANVIKDLQIDKTVTEESGSFEITATTDATHLRMYVIGAGCMLEVLKLSSLTSRLDEVYSLSKSNSDNIEEIKQKNTLDDAKPYLGKKILSLGDSFTYMNYYGKFLAKETGCVQRGRGVNGGHLGTFVGDSYTGSPNTPKVGQEVVEPFTEELLNRYDIITVMGGTNDFGGHYPLGDMNDDVDVDSIYGHTRKVIEKILSLKPDAKIFFCTQPYRCGNIAFHGGLGGYSANSRGVTLEDVASAIVRCCGFYGIPCLDFYHTGGWNSFNNKVMNPSVTGVYSPFDGNIYTVDGLHPRDGVGNGADMLGTAFGKFINRH